MVPTDLPPICLFLNLRSIGFLAADLLVLNLLAAHLLLLVFFFSFCGVSGWVWVGYGVGCGVAGWVLGWVSAGCEMGCGVVGWVLGWVMGLWGGFGWVAGWVWVAGWQWGSFLVDSGGFGCGYFLLICFTLLQTHNVEYFLEHFLRVQTNIRKTNVFL
jgi:hypothetical protein